MKILLFAFFAILPPYYESAREVKSLLAHPRTQELLGTAEPILNIERTERGYLIKTLTKALYVDIHYGGDDKVVGPAQFRFEFSEPVSY